VTTVRRVTGDARVAEVARMLSGTDTATGLAHARELLDGVAAGTV
jgi:DNA repair protein RecN (Recombination protein N)